jgi:hypothetical protein
MENGKPHKQLGLLPITHGIVVRMNAVDAQYFELLHLLLPRYLRVRNPAEIDAAIRQLEGVLSGSDSLSIHRVDWMPWLPVRSWVHADFDLETLAVRVLSHGCWLCSGCFGAV